MINKILIVKKMSAQEFYYDGKNKSPEVVEADLEQEKNLGLIKNHDNLEIAEAPSRARQKLEKGDLLLSGLRAALSIKLVRFPTSRLTSISSKFSTAILFFLLLRFYFFSFFFK